MEILGEKIRQIRKQKHMSQIELSKGICTQATISLIEKKNQVPSTSILLSICERLNVDIQDIIVSESAAVHDQLQVVEELILNDDLKQAENALKAIDSKSLQTNHDFERYYLAWGHLKLILNESPEDALYYYNKSYKQYIDDENSTYALACVLGMGVAYLKKGDLNQAKLYADKGRNILIEVPNILKNKVKLHLTAYYALAIIMKETHQKTKAIAYAKKAIDLAIKQQNMFLLDNFYYLLAILENQDVDTAKKYQDFANTISLILNHQLPDYIK